MLIMAAGEQDVLPAWGLLQAWGRKAKQAVCNLVIFTSLPNPSRPDAWRLSRVTGPTLDGVIVINEQVPHDHCLIPSQDNPLHKLRPQVLFHPAVLYRKNKTKLELNRL